MAYIRNKEDGTLELVLGCLHENDIYDVADRIEVPLNRIQMAQVMEKLEILANQNHGIDPDVIAEVIHAVVPEIPDTSHYTTMYHMEGAGRRAMLLISSGLETMYMVTCSEGNVFKGWIESDDFDHVRQHAEDFVMGRYSDE